MLTKIYLETTNVCNLSCSFCHGTKRKNGFLSYEDFNKILPKIKGRSKYLYFHLMGEPLLNADLKKMVHDAKEAGFFVMLTTNGTLLSENGAFIYESGDVKKVSISLQSADIKDGSSLAFGDALSDYLSSVADFSRKCAENGVICALRLWNLESENDGKNDFLIEKLHTLFPAEWIKNRSGYKLFDAPKGQKEVYLEFGELFEWPDKDAKDKNKVTSCYALRDQIGILCDGTVVPCCLDADGAIALGNIFDSSLEEILSSERAVKLLESFEKRNPCEKLCKTCGFSMRF